MDLLPLDDDNADLLSMVFSGTIKGLSLTTYDDHQVLTLHFTDHRSVSLAGETLFYSESGVIES